jgi:hypothetical protein
MGWGFNYIAITNDVDNAVILQDCGIQQIMVDAENLGKMERQSGKGAVINFHKIEDVVELKKKMNSTKIICRINGYHNNIFDEIEMAVNCGADFLMLPMIEDINDFKRMIKFIDGRVSILPLIETSYSIFKLKEIIDLSKPDQIHFGLNDLHISLGMDNLFEVLISPLFASAVLYASERVKIVGVGGIGDPMQQQKISPELLINEHKVLGSSSVILSRSFFGKGYEINRILDSLRCLEKFIAQEPEVLKHTKLVNEIEKF